MFNIFRRAKPEISASELKVLMQSAESDVVAKWLQFTSTMHFKDEVPLADRIDAFSQPLQQFLFKKYPSFQSAPGGFFWLLIFNAIATSKTHPQAQINEAVAVLKGRYARSS